MSHSIGELAESDAEKCFAETVGDVHDPSNATARLMRQMVMDAFISGYFTAIKRAMEGREP